MRDHLGGVWGEHRSGPGTRVRVPSSGGRGHPQPDGNAVTSTADSATAVLTPILMVALPGQSDEDTVEPGGRQRRRGCAGFRWGPEHLRTPACLGGGSPGALEMGHDGVRSAGCSGIRWKHMQDPYTVRVTSGARSRGGVCMWPWSLPDACALQLLCGFPAIKTAAASFVEIHKVILKFICDFKGPRRTKAWTSKSGVPT